MRDAAIPRRLLTPLHHSIIADDGGNAQAIVAEDSFTACRLRCPMPGVAAPLRDSTLVAPEGHGKELVGISKTLEPFNRYKSLHMLQLTAQARGMVQVVGLAAAGRPSLEDDSDHGYRPSLDSRRRQVPASGERGRRGGLETHTIRWGAPQRIRNDPSVGCCFGRVAYGPAIILSLAPCGRRAIVPPHLSSDARRG